MTNAVGIENEYDYGRYRSLPFTSKPKSEESVFLEEKFQSIQDEQGLLGKTWNGLKELTTLGISASDCESMLEKYSSGEISFEEAVNYLDKFDSKQESMSALLSNILTGVGGIAIATIAAGSGPIGWGLAFAKGAPIGAALKTGINLIDRSTNNIEGDEFDLKKMGKDAISGALTGATSAVSSGVGAGIKAGQFGLTVANGVKCGAMCGSMSGATSYMTDVAFGDEDFEFKELATNTLVSGASSALVGGVVGAGLYGNACLNKTVGQAVEKTVGQTIVQDSGSSSTRKILGTKVKGLLSA